MRREPPSLDRGARESVVALADAGGRRRVSAPWLSGLGMLASRALACVGALVGVAVWCSLVTSSSASAASPVVVTFSSLSNWAVPAGVTSVTLTVRGGGGGSGFSGGSTSGAGGGGTQVTGTWAVTPAQYLTIGPGPAGGNGSAPDGWCGFNAAQDVSQGGAGGNGAGGGGLGDLCGGGGGGGGGCDSSVTVTNWDNSSQLLVDAGGGGGGGGGGGIAGFGGGGGGPGGVGPGNAADGAGPGHGSGGAGGQYGNSGGGQGGGAGASSSAGGGGGGGCGYATGQGGNGGTGGGGGAGGGGGGGAGDSFVGGISNVVTSTGPSGAQGVVTISYTPAASAVQIISISPNASGASAARAAALRDTGTNRSLNGEWIRLRNVGRSARQLRGWSVSDGDGHVYRFGRLELRAGASVTVHSGRGRDTGRHRYWGRRGEVWDNNRDIARLRRPDGTLASRCRYDHPDASLVRC